MSSTDDLLALLPSPDPHQRDEVAYAQLAERISEGTEDGRLATIGDRCASLLGHRAVQARTFGALVLAETVERDAVAAELAPATVHGWQDALCRWYLAEDELRGWDPALGWLHAVAHGADALGTLGRSRHTTRRRLTELLAVARDRLLTTGDVLLVNAEEDRVAFAMVLALSRPELSEDDATGWLDPVRAAFAAGEPGPLPAWVSNTSHTLQALYVLAARGVKAPSDPGTLVVAPHRDALLEALARTMRETFQFIG